jgi:hypothetical protein
MEREAQQSTQCEMSTEEEKYKRICEKLGQVIPKCLQPGAGWLCIFQIEAENPRVMVVTSVTEKNEMMNVMRNTLREMEKMKHGGLEGGFDLDPDRN